MSGGVGGITPVEQLRGGCGGGVGKQVGIGETAGSSKVWGYGLCCRIPRTNPVEKSCTPFQGKGDFIVNPKTGMPARLQTAELPNGIAAVLFQSWILHPPTPLA